MEFYNIENANNSYSDGGSDYGYAGYADMTGGDIDEVKTDSRTHGMARVEQNVVVLRNIRRSKYDEQDETIAELSNRLHPMALEIKVDVPRLEDVGLQTQIGVYYPNFGNGFFHWIHSGKNKMIDFSKFENKKKVYYVVNGYEQYVDEYDSSIQTVMDNGPFFSKTPIVSRSFFKIWEILHYYDLINTSTSSKTLCVSNYPGALVQAVSYFREKYKIKSNTSNTCLKLEPEENDVYADDYSQTYAELDDKFFSSNKAITVKTHKLDSADSIKKLDAADSDLIIAEGGYNYTDENIQEQRSQFLIFAEIVTAISSQKKGGSLILKMFEMFTELSYKFIVLLKHFYSKVYIMKPLMSRDIDSERYVVCKGFDGSSSKSLISKLADSMDKIKQIADSSTADSHFIIDIFPSYEITFDLRQQITSMNISITNAQYKLLNKMIEFIDGSNYHGDLYRQYRERQIELSKYWLSTFEQNKDRKDAAKLIEQAEKEEMNHLAKMNKKYVKTEKTDKTDKTSSKAAPIKAEAKAAPSKKMSRTSARSRSKSKSKPKSKARSKPKSAAI